MTSPCFEIIRKLLDDRSFISKRSALVNRFDLTKSEFSEFNSKNKTFESKLLNPNSCIQTLVSKLLYIQIFESKFLNQKFCIQLFSQNFLSKYYELDTANLMVLK